MEPPVKPDEADCCNSGCIPCILDVYEEQLKKFKATEKNPVENSSTKKNCISPTTYTIFKLVKIMPHSQDTNLYVFEYVKPYRGQPEENLEDLYLWYKPGQHFLLRGDFGYENEQFTKAYTPIPYGDESRGSFTVLIKLYEGGLMSRYINKLKVNSETVWRGPYGDFSTQFHFKNILCVAQGTGIAPIYAVIRQILENEECETFLKLFFCCRSLEDVHLHNELYNLCSHWNFSYEIFLSNVELVNYKYKEVINTARLDREDIKVYLIGKSFDDTQILICGNEQFTTSILENVSALNFNMENVFCF